MNGFAIQIVLKLLRLSPLPAVTMGVGVGIGESARRATVSPSRAERFIYRLVREALRVDSRQSAPHPLFSVSSLVLLLCFSFSSRSSSSSSSSFSSSQLVTMSYRRNSRKNRGTKAALEDRRNRRPKKTMRKSRQQKNSELNSFSPEPWWAVLFRTSVRSEKRITPIIGRPALPTEPFIPHWR